MPSALDTLTHINLDDFFESLGWPRGRYTPLRWLFWPAARRFAQLMVEFDRRVGAQGLSAGSAWLLQKMTGGLQVAGQDNVPANGPAFILSNHPGMADTIALFAGLAPRPDLRVIALERPFLRALPNVSRQVIYLPSGEGERMKAVRLGVKHLKQGGALLTFPAGEIEPDPAAFGAEAALASLNRWSDSIELFARFAPQTQLVPAIVSHVVSPAALHHPLTRLRSTQRDKEKMAAALQVMWPPYQDLAARVAFGQAVSAQTPPPVMGAVVEQARRLIENPSTTWEHSSPQSIQV
jgi:acyltransferase-like protein